MEDNSLNSLLSKISELEISNNKVNKKLSYVIGLELVIMFFATWMFLLLW